MTAPPPAEGGIGRLVAANLRRHRERRGLSQAAVAAMMRERGHRWHPATVYRAEHGEQSLTVEELAGVAAVLGTTMDRLTWAEGDDAAAVLAAKAISALREAAEAVADSAARLLAARAGAETAIRSLRASKSAKGRSMADGIEDEMPGATLEEAVAEGGDRWQALREGRG